MKSILSREDACAWGGLSALLLLALLVRVAVTLTAYYPTIDSGTVGLMACHILEGERPLFFYGQTYMGALEAYVAAGFAFLMGPTILAVSMSPIVFSLGWLVVLWLLVRELYGLRAAFAAAGLIAVPPWHILWYSIGSYGGYPGTWFFGTAALWLAVQQWKTTGASTWAPLRFVAFGLCTGLGFWTNPQSVMITGPAWVLLAAWALRERFRREVLVQGVVAGIVALLGAAPVLLSAGSDLGPHAGWTWRADVIGSRVSGCLLPGLATLTSSRESLPTIWALLVWATVAVGTLLAAEAVRRCQGIRDLLWRCAPWMVVIFALFVMLPYDMMDERAPRYLVPIWTALAVWLFAMPLAGARGRRPMYAAAVVALWIALQSIGVVTIVQGKRGKRADVLRARDRIVEASRTAGHPYAYLVGGEIFGHRGQPWNFHGRARTRFVSSFDERHRRTAESAEFAEDYALACDPELKDKLAATLRDLDVEYEALACEALALFHALRVPLNPAESVSPAHVALVTPDAGTESADALLDRRWDTRVRAPYHAGAVIELDLGRDVELEAMTLFSPHWFHDDLPTAIRIEASDNARDYRVVRETANRFSNAYRAGGRVFVKGYLGCFETSFRGISARYLRIIPVDGAARFPEWAISELFVFEKAQDEETPSPIPGAASCLDLARRHDVRLLIADRAQSARLRAAASGDANLLVYPRYNPKFPDTTGSRMVAPGDGTALLVARRYVEECVHLLDAWYGPGVLRTRIPMGAYEMLLLRDAEPNDPEVRLLWNGHTLLAGRGPEPRWH